jgi:uncharacterized protein with HEPN domain
MKRPDARLLLDMLLAARRVREYVEGVSRQAFEADPILQDAVTRRLEIIGEAAARIAPETRALYSSVPWGQIVGMRNRLIHEYFRVDIDVLWQVVTGDLPPLILHLEESLAGNGD